MGYRLHVKIPNVPPYEKYLELGTQYDEGWRDFNDRWFDEDRDEGLINYQDLPDFIKDLKKMNCTTGKTEDDRDLYNLEWLDEMVEHCREHKTDIYFCSF